ncbi:hypothetical protein Tco_0011278 [Tanacetum coccineum]
MQEPSESGTRKAVPPSQHDLKDNGKAKMIEPEKPLKKKDQIKFDEEVAKRLAEELEAELEEENVTIKKEEANLISWDNTQAMIEADYELAQRLQAEKQGELTIEERSILFVELMDKRKKHFAKLRAKKIKRKPPIDWKTHILAEDKMYYQIIKADGSEKYYKIFSAMLNNFDRQDVLDLYRLVKERFETASPKGYDILLWGDLITLFEPSEEDEI